MLGCTGGGIHNEDAPCDPLMLAEMDGWRDRTNNLLQVAGSLRVEVFANMDAEMLI